MGVRGCRATLVWLLTVFQLFTLSHAPVSSSTDQKLDRRSPQTFRIPLAHPQNPGAPGAHLGKACPVWVWAAGFCSLGMSLDCGLAQPFPVLLPGE